MNAPVTAGETCGAPSCNERIDPESHSMNAETGERYCSGRCWAEGVLD